MGLGEYHRKRNFEQTPEPRGGPNKYSSESRFVVQRHQAGRLHYDLRLEIAGTLKSWALPKGPSMNPKDKRLAVQTEDHPLEYLSFEGRIPKGNYGAGVMEIWDSGSFHTLSNTPAAAFKSGQLKLLLKGSKLKGEFTLVQTRRGEDHKQWLLIKKDDEHATNLEYNAEKLVSEKEQPAALKPGNIVAPMLATRTLEAFNHPDWLFELKWDGYRVMAHLMTDKVRLHSRNGSSYDKRFAEIRLALEELGHESILDGEVVLLDKQGKPMFQGLQNYTTDTPGELRYFVFDLLYLNGHSTTGLSLRERKELLRELIIDQAPIFYCDHIDNLGKSFFTKAVKQGLEGVMAKKKDSKYWPGSRSESWLKIKSGESQEAIICGYTESTAGEAFGSLILGLNSGNGLEYIGNCGSGFTTEFQYALLARMQKLKQNDSPFPGKIKLKGRKPSWLRPQLVCEVHFSEWTKAGRMRHPVFKGLREDKIAEEISKEDTHTTPESEGSKTSANSLEVNGIEVPVSNLEKVFWPDEGLRKYDVFDYYIKVAKYILPYLKDRPQNLHRHPDGIQGDSFYQKDQPDILPHWLETTGVYSESSDKEIKYLLCQDEAALLFMANLGCIEINPWNSRVGSLAKPDYTVIDLDPSPKNTLEEVIEVAQAFQDLLLKAEIKSYCKTSGSRGLHIYLPLGAKYDYEQARDFTRLLCHFVNDELGEITTLERSLKSRGNRIYLDYLQNRRGQTLAAAYCLRPRPGAPVSTPLEWREVKPGLKIQDFNIHSLPERLSKKGDFFKPVLGEGIDMAVALEKLAGN